MSLIDYRGCGHVQKDKISSEVSKLQLCQQGDVWMLVLKARAEDKKSA